MILSYYDDHFLECFKFKEQAGDNLNLCSKFRSLCKLYRKFSSLKNKSASICDKSRLVFNHYRIYEHSQLI